jgi:hypothetical protein
MNTLTKVACGIGAALIFAFAHAAPPTVNPEAPDLDPDISAKILKEKAKRNPGATPAGNSGGSNSSSSGCGQVNINSNDNSKKKISGIGDIMGNKSTTIVTGDVINMANCK